MIQEEMTKSKDAKNREGDAGTDDSLSTEVSGGRDIEKDSPREVPITRYGHAGLTL